VSNGAQRGAIVFGHGIAIACRGGEDRGQHVAGFDRGQLVRIAEQEELRAIGDRVDQLAHQRQVDHRGFVHHHDVERQRVVGVVAERGDSGNGAEQAVQGAGPARARREQCLVDAAVRPARRARGRRPSAMRSAARPVGAARAMRGACCTA
jgi:hypothetical protein